MSDNTRWGMPKTKPIRDQAAERGEPIPFGVTLAELARRGYEVRDDIADCAILLEEADSPTGCMLAIKIGDLEFLVNNDEGMMEAMTARLEKVGDDLKEAVCYERIITAGWCRRHKLGHINKALANWATVRAMAEKDGYLVGFYWNSVPAVAPTDEEFDAESQRRVAVGMAPLEEWRRPARFHVRTWVGVKGEMPTEAVIAAAAAADAPVDGKAPPPPEPEEP